MCSSAVIHVQAFGSGYMLTPEPEPRCFDAACLPLRLSSLTSSCVVVFRCLLCEYFHDTDTLGIALTPRSTGLIDNSDDVTPGLLVDYMANNQLVGFDVMMASSRTGLDIASQKKGSAAAFLTSLHSQYDAEEDRLSISFVQKPSNCSQSITDDDRILICVDAHGCWEGIRICEPSKCIAGNLAANGKYQGSEMPSVQSHL